MGSLSVGLTYGWSKLSGIAELPVTAFTGLASNTTIAKLVFQEADGIATGWSLGAKYDLSKRTSLTANYAAWTRAGYSQAELYLDNNQGTFGIIGYGPIETQANILLSHSF
jgi:predicted porin